MTTDYRQGRSRSDYRIRGTGRDQNVPHKACPSCYADCTSTDPGQLIEYRCPRGHHIHRLPQRRPQPRHLPRPLPNRNRGQPVRSLWRNPSWLRVIAWLLLIAYLELKPPDGEAGWLLIGFIALEARATIVEYRRSR